MTRSHNHVLRSSERGRQPHASRKATHPQRVVSQRNGCVIHAERLGIISKGTGVNRDRGCVRAAGDGACAK